MEWELAKLVWTSLMTLAVAIGGGLWKIVNDKIVDLKKELVEVNDRMHKAANKLHEVQLTYVQKTEMAAIEQRIDKRFEEMRDFFIAIFDRDDK